ncbi:MAG: hypothetical protein ABSH47_18640 [Bryobacteraceae bacterium]|jgi:hypothetical protein
MNKLALLVFAGCAVVPAQEGLPPAAAVLDRFVEVTGGRAAYEKHHSQIAKGTLSLPAQGISGSMTLSAAEPSKMHTRVEIGAIGTMQQGVSGEIAWELNPLQGPRIVEGAERADVLREARFNAPLHWREQYTKQETIGAERVGEDDCIKVRLTPNDGGHPETMYFSRKSGLLVKQTGTRATAMGDIPYENNFSNYRSVDGVMEPYKTTEKAAGQEVEVELSEMAFNVDVPDAIFDPPAEIQALLKKQKAAPEAPATPVTAGPGAGKFTIYMGGNQIATETYSLTHADGHYDLSGSGTAQIGPMKIDVELYRVVTDDAYQPIEASAKAKMGQVAIAVKTTFSGGVAHNEIDTGQGPQKKDDPAGAGDVVISQNLPLFPFALLARRVSTSTRDPQQFTAYVLGQGEAPLTVEYKGKEKVAFANRSEELNHFAATVTPPQGQPVTVEVWTLPGEGRIVKMTVPQQGVEVYQEGYEPPARKGSSPDAPAQSGTSNPK